jgi:hypothetical protein
LFTLLIFFGNTCHRRCWGSWTSDYRLNVRSSNRSRQENHLLPGKMYIRESMYVQAWQQIKAGESPSAGKM